MKVVMVRVHVIHVIHGLPSVNFRLMNLLLNLITLACKRFFNVVGVCVISMM